MTPWPAKPRSWPADDGKPHVRSLKLRRLAGQCAEEGALGRWQNQNEARRAAYGRLIQRARRAKALKRGEADPIFLPGTRKLAPDFQEALDRFMAERKEAAE
ncbi:hypothetical protein [Methylocystis parvus]|uniref:Uncharacterized protein n=1 Tax=Methylocystis parvus TaxID=134 RepID=A0A6B8M828_9HYPH|nr:hypothetical protein [Methylocystis parvus]QGM97789.1 hypothetical protein F7D14_10125 [Methylocystis parvus]WBK01904.1 hypothetical protein MMG94_09465 [Methylocystis parvus OBBP]